MKNLFHKIVGLIKTHKILALIILLVAGYGGYYGYQKYLKPAAPVRYVTQAAEKTTITVSVAGSGQVSELNKLDIKPLGSGALTAVKVKNGDKVRSGQVIATIDQRSSQVSINQARASLANARASLDKLLAGTTAIDIKISENSVTQAERSYNNALVSFENTKKTTTNDIAQAQVTLADLESISGVTNPTNKRGVALTTIGDKLDATKTALDAENKILTDANAKNTLSVQNISYLSSTQNSYDQAVQLLSAANNSLSLAKINRNDSSIDQAVNDAINVMNKTRDSLNFCFNALQNTISSASLSQSQIDSYKSSVSSQLSNMSTGISAIQTAQQNLKDALTAAHNDLSSVRLSADQQIASAQSQVDSSYSSWQNTKDQLAKLKTPATKQDVDAARAQVYSAQVQLQQAQDSYNNNILTAPFDGEITLLTVQKGDQVSPSTIIATLITQQEIVIIQLNEVDVAKIKQKDPVTLTFEAIDGLAIVGHVADIDAIGTVTSGVVTYNVKITLDTQDDRIKPGMSTSAMIITQVKTDILAIPNAAVKSNGGSYVEVLGADGKPEQRTVTTGLSNDSQTEIVTGLSAGDEVVTQTIDPNTATTAATNGAANQRGGFGGFGGLGR
jgi:RND family efflux transporter MFP subunit